MALATQCPYCNTIFRVASDQLKLRGGIVRCGRCSEAFDGHAGLIDPAMALTSAPVEPVLTQAPKPTPAPELPLHYLAATDIAAAAAQQSDHQTDLEPELELEPEPEFDLDLDFDIDAEPATPSALEPGSDFLSKPAPEHHWIDLAALTAADEARLQREARLTAAPAEARHKPEPEARYKPEPEPEPEARYKPEPEAETEARYKPEPEAETDPDARTGPERKTGIAAGNGDNIEAEAEAGIRADTRAEIKAQSRHPSAINVASRPDSAEPEFILQGRRKQRQGKAVAILTGLGALLLLLALLAQGAMTFGSQLAAQAPQLAPALTRICSILGCRIALPMQIKAIAIELGELQTLNAGTFSYATVLHNNSSTAQAWPNIELTLTDGADKAVLRRVFTPRDYLAAQLDTTPGFAARSEQALKLYFELTRINASGYHIAVFYP